VRLHRFLSGVARSIEVEHVDRNTLNNRPGNVRPFTRARTNLSHLLGGTTHPDAQGDTMLGMGEGDAPNSKVVRLPRNLDASGRPLRKEGPCYICSHPTSYGYSGYHARHGDAWIDKWFKAAVRASHIERLKSGAFLRYRTRSGNTLRQLLKFVCRPCLADMKDRLWPEARERERVEAQQAIADPANLDAPGNSPRPDYAIRMVMRTEREIEIRCGECAIGKVDFDERSGRLRVILGDAHVGTELPHMWTGGPAAVVVDLRSGIEGMRNR